MNKPKKLWVAWLNMGGGLHGNKPRRVTYMEDLDSYWDKTGDYDCRGAGLEINDSCASFASEDKEEVEIFIDGIQTFIAVCLKRYV